MGVSYSLRIYSIAALLVQSDDESRVDDGFELFNRIYESLEIGFYLLVGYLYGYVEPTLSVSYTDRKLMLLSQKVYTCFHIVGEIVLKR